MNKVPYEINYCKKCVINNQRPLASPEHKKKNLKVPTVSFKNGICDACHYYELKKNINWQERERFLVDLLNHHKDPTKQYDVLVPGSGGKDSIFVSHLLKNKYGMRPLTVTWAPNIYTDIGIKNYLLWSKIGHDCLLIKPNEKIHSEVTRNAFLNLVNPFQPFIVGQKNYAPKIALKYGIKLIMYGENTHTEGQEGSKMNISHYSKSDKEQIFIGGKSIENYIEEGFNKNDFYYYIPEDKSVYEENQIEIHHMSYFHRWSPQDNYYYVMRNSEFQPNTTRSEGTYTKYSSLDDKIDGQHYYTMLIKFGQGRCMNDANRDIRDGYLSRDEAISLMKKYDQEFPKKNFDTFLNYINIDEDQYFEKIDSVRPKHLWEKLSKKEWKLKSAIWN